MRDIAAGFFFSELSVSRNKAGVGYRYQVAAPPFCSQRKTLYAYRDNSSHNYIHIYIISPLKNGGIICYNKMEQNASVSIRRGLCSFVD